jgi:hypothetical protein
LHSILAGPASSTTSAALATSLNQATSQASIIALTPLASWNQLAFRASDFIFVSGGSSQVASIAADGTLTTLGPVLAPAATASATSIRIPHGAAPSSPTNGDVWTTTAGIYVRVNGSTVGPLGTGGGATLTSGTLFTSGALTNNTGTTEVSGVGAGTGSMTLAANALTAGKSIRLRFSGEMEVGGASPTFTFKYKIGGLSFSSSHAAITSTAGDVPVWGEWVITCLTTGGSGTFRSNGTVSRGLGGVGGAFAQAQVMYVEDGPSTSIDTTTTQLVDFSSQFSTGTNNFTVHSVTLEYLSP